MASLDFFAVREDQIALLSFLFAETDLRAFELSSVPDHPLRSFGTVAELSRTFALGVDKHGTGLGVTLLLHSPSVMREPLIRRIALDPKRNEGATFRESLEGGGLIQLYLGGVHDKVITKTHFGHNSRERAEKWSVAEGVNWDALSKVSGKIQRYVRKTSVAKVPGRPILPEASELWTRGYVLKEFAGSPHHWTSEGLRPDV